MKLFRFLLLAIAFLPISVGPFDRGRQAVPEIIAGPLVASVGVSPITGKPSGWYTSDVTIHILAPADTLANGKPLQNGKLTISDEGQHDIELQPGPFGKANTVTQNVDIDKTAPQVTWISELNSAVPGFAALSAEITDATSGICSIDDSLDNGRSWETQFLVQPGSPDAEVVHTTIWSLHRDFSAFKNGPLVIILRAHDCAGNLSPGEILVIQANNPR
jgi:hypothetical protein